MSGSYALPGAMDFALWIMGQRLRELVAWEETPWVSETAESQASKLSGTDVDENGLSPSPMVLCNAAFDHQPCQ